MRAALKAAVLFFAALGFTGLYWRLYGPRSPGRITESGGREDSRLVRLRRAGL